jgi:hypothetical protein
MMMLEFECPQNYDQYYEYLLLSYETKKMRFHLKQMQREMESGSSVTLKPLSTK